MNTFNISALDEFFADEQRLVELRYVFSTEEETEGEKPKVYCEYVVGNRVRHENFMNSLVGLKVKCGYFEYIREINPLFLFTERNIFSEYDNLKKEGD